MKKKWYEPETARPRFKKLLLAMRLTLFFICVAIFSSHAASYAQGNKLRIKVKDKEILEVLNIIENQAGYSFMFDTKQVNVSKTISLDATSKSVEAVLDEVFEGSNVGFRIIGKHIMLFKEVQNTVAQQSKAVKGRVIDMAGEPIPGVSVLIKGTTTGTITDIDGNYSLEDLSDDAVLIFSFIGLKTQEVVIADKEQINITMINDAIGIGEVVAIGYGTQTRRELTGSVASTQVEDVGERPVKNIVDYLQGNLPGVTVSSSGGSPTSGSSIVIRGLSTINENNPIFVVDGVISSVGEVNPNDIESVTVLKDAASAAIYGARAAGGVILIETKKGEKGKMRVDANVYVGFNKVDESRLPDLLNANEYADLRNLAAVNGGTVPFDADNALLNPKNRITRTDWLDAIFRTGITENYSISLSGASDKSNYYSSIRYAKDEGIMLNTWKKQAQLRFKSEHQLNSVIKLGQNFAVDWSKGLGGDSYRSAMYYPRSASVYNADGSFGGVHPVDDPFGGGAFPDLRNPVADLLRGNSEGPGNMGLQLNTFIEVKPMSGLTVKSLVGYGRSMNYYKSFTPTAPEPGLPRTENYLQQSSSVYQNLLWETTVDYKKTFNEKHNLNVLAGYTLQKSRSEGINVTGRDYDNEDDPNVRYLDYAKSVNPSDIGGAFGEEGIISYLSRVNYNYMQKYFFTGSIRRDGTSRLLDDQRWGVFPSASFSWILSEENFFPKGMMALNTVKLRSSWGEIGNVSALNSYPTKLSVSPTRYQPIVGGDVYANLVTGMAVNGIENNNLRWETVSSVNFGLDLQMLNKKVDLTLDYYIKNTKDMIVQPPLAGTAGVANAPYLNIGNVENKGIELNLGFHDQKGDFRYAINGNLSSIKNKITSLSGVTKEINFGDHVRNTLFPIKAVVGEPVICYYVIPTGGIFQTDEEANNYVNGDGEKIQPNAKAGDLKFIDTNNDGMITDNDRVYGGDPFPDFTYGFNANVGYKNLDLTVFIQGVQNVELFAGYKLYSQNASLHRYNHTRDVLNAWSPTNTGSTIPMVSTVDNNNNFRQTSDYYIEDGSYMRLKNVTLGYTLPQSVLNKLKVAHLKFYVTGQNLITLTKYEGSDPEIGGKGIDQGTYPIPRTIIMGMNLKF